MLKNLRNAAIVFAAVGALVSGSALADTVSLGSGATILQSLGLTPGTPLQFGRLVSSSVQKSVTVDVDSVVSGDIEIVASGITPTAASLTITGTPDRVVNISLVSTSDTLTGPEGSTPMALSGLTLSRDTATLQGGTAAVTVGGTLTVGANQAPGAYTGDFDVTVSYQ